MSMTIELHNRTFYQRATFLLTLCALAGCNDFLVSICEFEARATCTADASSNTDLAQRTDDGGPVTAIQERKFDLRASFTLGNCQKFNGILDKKMLTLSKNGCTSSSAWEAWSLDLNNSDYIKRLNLTGVAGCPTVPSGFDFFKDEIYTTGGKFYYFQYTGNRQLFELKGTLQTQIMNIKLTFSSQPRAFVHPLFNAIAAAVEPVLPSMNSTVVLSAGSSSVFVSSMTPTTFVIGDLDSNDLTSNGEEIIFFDGKIPQNVKHWVPNGSMFTDDNLLASLNLAIARTKAGDESPIEAAFITGLNYDEFPDLIYSRSGQIYVTSYLGHDKNIDSRFKNWTDKIAVISGEKIKSLVAVELTDDAYPELVVETDKAVYFYVNTPK